jgi:phosphoglycerol geranylgeranyltransferase
METINFPGNQSIALLLDPDKVREETLPATIDRAVNAGADFIMAGGSLTFKSIDHLIRQVKEMCSLPVVLFPGNLLQLSHSADIIMLLSLISGRNPELLIGNHVIAAPYLRDIKEKVVSVGYILISCGSKTSVEYISQTESIPSDKTDIVVATAIAGELLGLKMIYLEAGSGSLNPVPAEIIRAVKSEISIPIAVGGGIRKREDLKEIFKAGANLIILGNGCENNPEFLAEACRIRDYIRN